MTVSPDGHQRVAHIPPMQSREESLAQAFHEAYERLAPSFGYRTREASAKPWHEVPDQNKALMTAVVTELVQTGWIEHPNATAQPGGWNAR